ncbi:hypothetical protein AVEN_102495-1 [Araneus ventricosus]|uniref:Uncharacterized protein n=1 Tax=Araneus ventricosus TaxID=182803 RepID=A0A4Y2NP77_ARAVE|nr:hypothetical protein AVEN_102495-1 [Araneus ventricosus]
MRRPTPELAPSLFELLHHTSGHRKSNADANYSNCRSNVEISTSTAEVYLPEQVNCRLDFLNEDNADTHLPQIEEGSIHSQESYLFNEEECRRLILSNEEAMEAFISMKYVSLLQEVMQTPILHMKTAMPDSHLLQMQQCLEAIYLNAVYSDKQQECRPPISVNEDVMQTLISANNATGTA